MYVSRRASKVDLRGGLAYIYLYIFYICIFTYAQMYHIHFQKESSDLLQNVKTKIEYFLVLHVVARLLLSIPIAMYISMVLWFYWGLPWFYHGFAGVYHGFTEVGFPPILYLSIYLI